MALLYEMSRCIIQQSMVYTIKQYTFESFTKHTGVMEVRWKAVPGRCTGVAETVFTKFSSCSRQNVICRVS